MSASPSSYTSSVTSSLVAIDVNHPYYLHPSDNPGMTLTTVTLTEHNYNQWSRSMEIALSSKLKLGFVDVSVDIRNSIVYMKTARLIWQDLATRYAQSNVPQLFHHRKELSQLSQGPMSVAAYFTKYRTLSDELECLSVRPKCNCTKCTCNVNDSLEKYEQSVQLTQFLMGLNEHYTAVRGQILIMTPLPTLSQCYSMLLQEETQRNSPSHMPV
ncbi:uncharacterized protein LOC141714707 [Apium graveolens]|uniref:uncharacterized protein LOC141714707 n=1 Tax=Apium graveolens TaxID=4045 RepID=UPI003D7A0527